GSPRRHNGFGRRRERSCGFGPGPVIRCWWQGRPHLWSSPWRGSDGYRRPPHYPSSMDEGHAISYKLLQRGTPVHASDGALVGTVMLVLENKREHIFDGINVDTPAGPRFVDAPEVARITERLVTLSIDSETAAALPRP